MVVGEKSYWKSPVLEVEKIRDQFILGLEQAKDTIMPEIQFCKKFRPFAEDKLPGMIKKGKAFVAHFRGYRFGRFLLDDDEKRVSGQFCLFPPGDFHGQQGN